MHSSQRGTAGINPEGWHKPAVLSWDEHCRDQAMQEHVGDVFLQIHGKEQQALLRPVLFPGSLQSLITSTRISQSGGGGWILSQVSRPTKAEPDTAGG